MTSTTFTSHVKELASSGQSQRQRDGRMMLLLIILFVIAVLGGVAYGIVQMQHSVDRMYHSHHSSWQAGAIETVAISETAVKRLKISAGNPVHGRELFNLSCFVCHGPTGAGVPTLGPTLRLSKFVADRTDKQLVAFIKVGRQPGDPNSILRGTMPPKGGNPMLDDTGVLDVVAYIRVLQAGGNVMLRSDGVATNASMYPWSESQR